MNREIEAKMRLSDLALLESKLSDAGAELASVFLEVNTYYDTPQGTLKSSDQGLRLRVMTHEPGGEQEITITHKGPRALGKLKDRPETQMGVSDSESANELLIALGYCRVLTFEKRRRRWKMGECLVELDAVPYLGEFIEIEGASEQAVFDARRDLGLEGEPMIQHSYISMLNTYLIENHIDKTYIGFDSQASVV